LSAGDECFQAIDCTGNDNQNYNNEIEKKTANNAQKKNNSKTSNLGVLKRPRTLKLSMNVNEPAVQLQVDVSTAHQ